MVMLRNAVFSDWQGFRKPAGSRVGVDCVRVRVVFCVPGNNPYPGHGWARVATGIYFKIYLIKNKTTVLQSVVI